MHGTEIDPVAIGDAMEIESVAMRLNDGPVAFRKAELPCDVLNIVAQYYPSNQIPVKAQCFIEGQFDEGHFHNGCKAPLSS